ncbi:MAG TPA: VTC domain-containing protein [Candidatus Binatia bacterium]|nr:VTC domain-containing protein [Candidatus Binatia bacterium]
MKNQTFNDRIEDKYQVGISESEVAGLWRDLRSFLGPHGLVPVQEITSVGSVYFDNKDCDLLRYSLLGRLMLVRVRSYEMYGRRPEPINEYWVEVKTAADQRRKKRRFRLNKGALLEFLEGKDAGESVFDYNGYNVKPDLIRDLYRETQETVFTMGLQPLLLVVYKRVAFQSEVERLSIDWDMQYHYVTNDVFDYDSWKYLVAKPAGKSDKVILEMKYLHGGVPAWFHELQQKHPIQRREYLKPIEGMGFLFQGPLRHHKEANYFLPMIKAYIANSERL